MGNLGYYRRMTPTKNIPSVQMATADPPSQSLFAKEELTEQQRARGADGTGDDQSMATRNKLPLGLEGWGGADLLLLYIERSQLRWLDHLTGTRPEWL